MSCWVPFLSHFMKESVLRLPQLAMSINKLSTVVSDESLDHVFFIWILILFKFLTIIRMVVLWFGTVCHFLCNYSLRTQNWWFWTVSEEHSFVVSSLEYGNFVGWKMNEEIKMRASVMIRNSKISFANDAAQTKN